METATSQPRAPFDAGLHLVLPSKTCPPAAGWHWVTRAWKLFAAAPLMWVISLVMMVVLAIAMSLLPIVGTLVFHALGPVIAAGYLAACRSLETGGEFEIEHLLAGFTHRFGPLLMVGIAMTAAMVVLVLILAVVVGFSLVGAFLSNDPEAIRAAIVNSGPGILLAVLVVLAVMVPILAAYWFAPALVFMHGVSPMQAMKQSFVGCMRNIIPSLVFSVVALVLLVLAAIPLGLGLLVWWPLMIAATYAAYRDIYTEESAPAPAPFAATPAGPAA